MGLFKPKDLVDWHSWSGVTISARIVQLCEVERVPGAELEMMDQGGAKSASHKCAPLAELTLASNDKAKREEARLRHWRRIDTIAAFKWFGGVMHRSTRPAGKPRGRRTSTPGWAKRKDESNQRQRASQHPD